MDLVYTNDEEEVVEEDDDDIDDTASQSGRCGICTDVVIDRGVIDSCNHWFCFACIDNWAVITNLCPLCNNEFQLITCLPVYDTTGSIKFEENSFPRDDDWCIQGNNNTLSFPSYYIDENAVTCLDDDGCKIRNGLPTAGEDLTYDTSIACDSCDIWYHAFCVGFNPECTSENSWLCPRCISNNERQKSDMVSMQIQNLPIRSPQTGHQGCIHDSSFSGKVSISVADDGETAVVVSMVEGGQMVGYTEGSSEMEQYHSTVNQIENPCHVVSGNKELDVHLNNSGSVELMSNDSIRDNGKTNISNALQNSKSSDIVLDISPEMAGVQPDDNLMTVSLSLPLSRDVSPSPCYSERQSDPKANNTEQAMFNPCNHDRLSSPSVETSAVMNELPEVESINLLSSAGGKMVISTNEEMVDVTVQEKIEVNGRKHTQNSQSLDRDVEHMKNQRKREKHLQVEIIADRPAKKTKSDRTSQLLPSKIQVNSSVSENSKRSSRIARDSDIMSIVQENDNGTAGTRSTGRAIEKKDIAAGLRVKKIVRRSGDGKESSVLVQNLRKEITEAIEDKSSNDIGKLTALDAKLLTAFRAAVVKPKNESSNKFDPSLARLRKSFLQKGKVRENLTKKIYATSTGRRKRAWDREWEVEFWKHRCTKPEKVETLQSVLELLKKATNYSSENADIDQEPEGETNNSILSRVYLADASVFPRKDDIKPLSSIDSLEHDKKDSQSVFGKNMKKTPIETSRCSSQIRISTSKEAASSRKGNFDEQSRPTTTKSSSSIDGKQNLNEVDGQSDPAKRDKRKWAMEVLARRNALTSPANKDNQEDISVLKQNYPLLAQLPTDMRPVLAPFIHKKIPVSVRQTQLFRITEHYLRRTNLAVIRRTADTELAVADALNVEKYIFEKSNSKLVYLNLCSQYLSQLAKKSSTAEKNNLHSPAPNTKAPDPVAEEISSDPSITGCSKVEEALKLAGLSDSPPNSPCRPKAPINAEKDAIVENVLDIDSNSHLELDIYGDFEYDLEDEGYIASRVPKVQLEGDSRMKVVLSTIKCGELDNFPSPKQEKSKVCSSGAVADDPGNLKTVQAPCGSPSLVEPPQGEIYGEPSLAECEELYGPEKELIIHRISNIEEVGEPNDMKVAQAGNGLNGNGDCRLKDGISLPEFETESCAENIIGDGGEQSNNESHGEVSPTHSLTGENISKRKVKRMGTKVPDFTHSVSKKVEAYIKEHIRPLCKSGVISVEQYRWAVGKTRDKVMMYHSRATSANFLIKEGEKVKKLAEQYVEAAHKK